MSSSSEFLPRAVYEYLIEHSVREPEVLAELRQETARLAESNMQIGPEQGQFMALLVRLIGARRCIEVGVFTGYSSLAVALALPEDGHLLACDVSEEWTAIARRYWQQAAVTERIELVLRPALETLDARIAAGESGSYDFAFIDADKTGYADYYERVMVLLREGGLVTIDNTLWSGKLADPNSHDADIDALRAFNDKLHGDQRIDLAMLPVADGLTLARKRSAG